jgi:hypothetical protein
MGGLTLTVNRPFWAPDAEKLRELAAWYREFAERAGKSAISESRLRIAEELEEEADLLEEERRAAG